jgi:Flp pilus assembly protein TadG
MSRLANVFRRFVASRRAVAAIEFAMVVPILLLMLLASFDAGNGIAVYMKVRSAAYTLAAITNQYPTIQTADMTAITSATAKVLAPYSSAPAVVVISQIQATSATQAVVSWSYSPTAGNALTQGATFSNLPANFAQNTCGGVYNPPCYMILAQVQYSYSPLFGYFMTGPITLSDSLYTTPRTTVCVLYPPQSVNSC